jgi:general secretion pathway protein D
VRIIPDESNNLLLIKASPSDYQRIMGVLRRIDRAPLQVMINATIAEVTLNDTLRYGVQVFLKGKKFSGGHVNAQEIPLAPAYPGLNFIIGSFTDPRIVLDALASVTEVKVVSSPSVVVVDNQPALLKVGDEVPVSTQQTASIELPNAPIVSSIRFRDTGVILKVIPRVNSSGLVTMDIEQEISAVVPQPGGPTLTPTISQRRIASTISVYSGQMVALGGLISEQHNLDKSGLPVINRVPILGELIGSNERAAKRTELIVFIRPQVIRDPRDARDVAEELRSRLQSMATPPPPPHDWHTRTR